MKKFFAVFGVCLLCLSAFGCSGGFGNGAVTYKVGVLVSNRSNAFLELYSKELADYFTSLEDSGEKYDVTVLSAKGSAAMQLAQVKTFADQGFDVLIVDLVESTGAINIIKAGVAYDEVSQTDNDEQTQEEDSNTNETDTLPEEEQSAPSEPIVADTTSADNVITDETIPQQGAVPAEPSMMINEVYSGETKERVIPVVFVLNSPDLTQPEEITLPDGTVQPAEQVDTSLCCYVGSNPTKGAKLLTQLIDGISGKGDKNSDGAVNCIFIAGETLNSRNSAYIEEIKAYYTQADVTLNVLGTKLVDMEGEDLAKAFRNVMDPNAEKVEMVFCLDDKAVEAVYLTTNEGRPPEVESETVDTGESGDQTKQEVELNYYDIGEDFYLLAMSAGDNITEMALDGKINGTVSFDYVTQAHKAADAAVNYLKHQDNEKTFETDYILPEKKEEE